MRTLSRPWCGITPVLALAIGSAARLPTGCAPRRTRPRRTSPPGDSGRRGQAGTRGRAAKLTAERTFFRRRGLAVSTGLKGTGGVEYAHSSSMRILALLSDNSARRLEWSQARAMTVERHSIATLERELRTNPGGLVMIDPTVLRDDVFERFLAVAAASGARAAFYCEPSPLACRRILAANATLVVDVVFQGSPQESDLIARAVDGSSGNSVQACVLHRIAVAGGYGRPCSPHCNTRISRSLWGSTCIQPHPPQTSTPLFAPEAQPRAGRARQLYLR